VSANFLSDARDGILLPASILIACSWNGIDFRQVRHIANQNPSPLGEIYIETFTAQIPRTKARYVKVTATSMGTMPVGYLFQGTPAWTFIDEVMIE